MPAISPKAGAFNFNVPQPPTRPGFRFVPISSEHPNVGYWIPEEPTQTAWDPYMQMLMQLAQGGQVQPPAGLGQAMPSPAPVAPAATAAPTPAAAAPAPSVAQQFQDLAGLVGGTQAAPAAGGAGTVPPNWTELLSLLGQGAAAIPPPTAPTPPAPAPAGGMAPAINTDILNQLIGQLTGGQEQARTANVQRFQDIMGMLEGIGTQTGADIEERGERYLQALGQQMVSSGLSTTTAPIDPAMAIMRETGGEQRRLQEMLAGLKGGFMERREDVGPDIGMYANLLSQLGLAQGQIGGGAFPAAAGGAAPAAAGGLPQSIGQQFSAQPEGVQALVDRIRQQGSVQAGPGPVEAWREEQTLRDIGREPAPPAAAGQAVGGTAPIADRDYWSTPVEPGGQFGPTPARGQLTPGMQKLLEREQWLLGHSAEWLQEHNRTREDIQKQIRNINAQRGQAQPIGQWARQPSQPTAGQPVTRPGDIPGQPTGRLGPRAPAEPKPGQPGGGQMGFMGAPGYTPGATWGDGQWIAPGQQPGMKPREPQGHLIGPGLPPEALEWMTHPTSGTRIPTGKTVGGQWMPGFQRPEPGMPGRASQEIQFGGWPTGGGGPAAVAPSPVPAPGGTYTSPGMPSAPPTWAQQGGLAAAVSGLQGGYRGPSQAIGYPQRRPVGQAATQQAQQPRQSPIAAFAAAVGAGGPPPRAARQPGAAQIPSEAYMMDGPAQRSRALAMQQGAAKRRYYEQLGPGRRRYFAAR